MKTGVAISLNIKGKLLFCVRRRSNRGVPKFGWVSLTRMIRHCCEVCMCSKQFYICFVRSICMLFL